MFRRFFYAQFLIKAHPRSRGENALPSDPALARRGSSPLSWGKPRIQSTISFDIRIIPAHAGKTVRCVVPTRSATVHPRSRGDNAPGIASASWFQGSSPLTRGKLTGGQSTPRASGSSPLTRGKPCDCGRRRHSRGLIPAHAGKTVADRGHARRGHGSSPLTRGKHLVLPVAQPHRGLIPAHAGKTCSCCACCGGYGAHPRSRGENQTPVVRLLQDIGSSPLTRGKPQDWRALSGGLGLIPAHAGKTWWPRSAQNR